MGRQRRIDRPGGWHHVMNRGAARAPTFLDDADRVEFCRLLGVANERYAVVVHAYCLMTNHFHLVLECPDGGLSSAMRDIGSTFSRHFNERQGRDGPLFRGRFHSIDIASDEQLLCAVRYVHRNALDLPAVTGVDRYRWSSHRAYLGARRRPPWLRTATVLDIFGGDAVRFDRFVASDLQTASVVEDQGRFDDALIETAVAHVRLHGWRAGDDQAAHRHLVRTVEILLLDERRWAGRRALAQRLGEVSRFARRRARQRLARDPLVAAALAAATSALGVERAECA